MRYYKRCDTEGNILGIGIGHCPDTEEVTQEEYIALKFEVEQVASYTDQVYLGEISMLDVPEEYQQRVLAALELEGDCIDTPLKVFNERLNTFKEEMMEEVQNYIDDQILGGSW